MADFEDVPIDQIDDALEKLGSFVGLLRSEINALGVGAIEMQVGGILPTFPRPKPIPFTGGSCDGFEFLTGPDPDSGGGCLVASSQEYIGQITAFLTCLFAGLEDVNWPTPHE